MYNAQKNEFIIGIKGLPQGRSRFGFHVGRSLFEEFGNGRILDADVDVTIELDKEGKRINLTDRSSGYVVVECDRCLEELRVPVSVEVGVEVLFGTVQEETRDGSSEEFLVVGSAEGELDLTQFIYDYICLSLPMKMVHDGEGCDRQMVARLQQGEEGERKKSAAEDSPFNVLKNLLNKENNN